MVHEPPAAAAGPSPDAFAPVMATGIVSVAAVDHQYHVIALILGVLAAAVFALLTMTVSAHVRRVPAAFGRQLRDPDVALRSFTFVAACGVLAARLGEGQAPLVWSLGGAALVVWSSLVPLAIIDMWSRPTGELRDHAHGAWLLAPVGTQSLAISAAHLAHGAVARPLLLLALAWWMLGAVGYLVVTWLIVWRAVATPFVPEQVTPDSWILMGALAIATLTGDRIIAAGPATSGLDWLFTLARPATLALWITASAWIPLLLYAQMWRAGRCAASLHYDRMWWAAVFPLGMYSTATSGLAVELRIPALGAISLAFFWFAMTTWLLVALGLLHEQWHEGSSRPRTGS
ncbi:tellurite resistance/C4-dicarboxylate transporter family protein [Pseudonocardia acidicola]|uniref:tellurite resistance/C4-dicarboxylate transporter family protein n=1 Tax=Pseudonocardia acidicola TaxID=2724939 RepID=UPI001B7CE2C2